MTSPKTKADAAHLRARARRLQRRADKLDGAADAAPRRPAAASAAKAPPAGTQPPPPPTRPSWRGFSADELDAALASLPPQQRAQLRLRLDATLLLGRGVPVGMQLDGQAETMLLSALAAGRDRPTAPAPEAAELRRRQDDRLRAAGIVGGSLVQAGG